MADDWQQLEIDYEPLERAEREAALLHESERRRYQASDGPKERQHRRLEQLVQRHDPPRVVRQDSAEADVGRDIERWQAASRDRSWSSLESSDYQPGQEFT